MAVFSNLQLLSSIYFEFMPLYCYNLYSYGLYSYGLYSYCLYSYGLYSCDLYSYGLYCYDLYIYGLQKQCPAVVEYLFLVNAKLGELNFPDGCREAGGYDVNEVVPEHVMDAEFIKYPTDLIGLCHFWAGRAGPLD